MARRLCQLLTIGMLSFVINACSTTTGAINTPIGKVQLGMYSDEVEDILGPGNVIGEKRNEGEFSTQTMSYPASDGRVYLVYYVNDIVRRWELKDRVSSVSQTR